MNEIANIHRNETIDYVLNLVRGLHRTEADRAAFYATQPHAISLENIARDRSGCLLQLVHAIEAGLFDRLDAEAAEATDTATEAFVDVADAERYALRDEYVNGADFDRGARAVEHVDYDEAEAVREIREEMALEAAGVESWDQL